MGALDDLSPRTVLVAHPGAELFGSDRMLLESVIGLREGGDSVVVTVPMNGPLVDELTHSGASVVIAPALVLRKALLRPTGWPRLMGDLLRGLGSARRILRQVRPDVVYVSTITIPLWPFVARLCRVPQVSHVHEAEASGSMLVNRMLYLPHRLARVVLVNSRFSEQTIGHALPSLLRRTRIVPNGVAGPIDPQPPRAELEGPLRVAYVGRLSPRKGCDLVISAASTLAAEGIPVEVTLIGDAFEGYEWYAAELRAQAKGSGVVVDFSGFQPDVWPLVASSDVLVVPSRIDEPFGNTAVEGVLALRPVIAADTSGLREAAGGYPTTVLVAVDDAAAIADALRDFRRDWSRLIAQVAESREEALRRHSPATYRAAVRGAVTKAAQG